MGTPQLLSIVVPCFDEADSIDTFVARLEATLAGLPELRHEVIFVDDGSGDGTLQRLLQLADARPAYTVLELSRNFGKEAALTAGIEAARGDAVVPIDADLQHPPEVIPALVAQWRAGSDVVLARRRNRDAPALDRRATEWFYRLHNRIAECPIPPDVGDFRLLDRSVVDALRQLPERRRFMKGLFAWVGFRQAVVDFDVEPRHAGNSRFDARARLRLAIDGIASFSVAPLRAATWIGASVAALALAHAAWTVGKTLLLGVELPGYASLMSTVLFLGGVQLLCIGLLGEYVGRIYGEAKQRPVYIVRRRHGSGVATGRDDTDAR
jgi:polyisoprenyl-phosphate glycosyltransferase